MENVGGLIRHWRRQRRLSQADLAEDAEVSTRHLSCVETGKAHPSRQMVLVLASALEVPLRQRNALLQAAGYPAAYRETDLDDPEMAQVRQALTFLLRQSEPYGAVVLDRKWDVLMQNQPMRRITQTLFPSVQPEGNLLRHTFTTLRPFIVNFEDVARETLHRIHREAVHTGDSELFALYEELAATVPEFSQDHWSKSPSLVMPVSIERNGLRLDMFTTLTTLGTPQDITLSELRIESYFPATPETEALLRAF